jgi:hypothetical protein
MQEEGFMGVRGYILVKLNKVQQSEKLWELIKRYESLDDIEFATNVVGNYDFVLTVDTKNPFEKVLDQIRKIEPDSEVVGLKVNNIYDKHREIKGLRILDELSTPSTSKPW